MRERDGGRALTENINIGDRPPSLSLSPHPLATQGPPHRRCSINWLVMTAIVDIQCFKGKGNLVVKELSIARTAWPEVKTWIFKPPYIGRERCDADLKQDHWLRENHHGLLWEDGDTEYDDLKYVLHAHLSTCEHVFSKGREKCDFLQKILKYRIVLDMEILGCPSLRKIKYKSSREVCSFYRHRKRDYECSASNCANLREWFLKNGEDKLISSAFRLNSYAGASRRFTLNTERLAGAGFFYSGVGDVVVCCICGLDLGSWNSRDSPEKDHRRWNPYCPLVRMPVSYQPPYINRNEIRWHSTIENSCILTDGQYSAREGPE